MEEIEILREKLKQNPNDYETLEEYAIMLSDIGENEEALKNFLFLKDKFPDNSKNYYNIGIILEKLKYNDKAVLAYEKALSLNSDNTDKAMTLSPDDTDILFNLAYTYIKTNQLEKAEQLLLKVIQTDVDDFNSYFHLGEIYSKQKKHDEAVKYLLKAVELNANDAIQQLLKDI